jgi:hypothetical protein
MAADCARRVRPSRSAEGRQSCSWLLVALLAAVAAVAPPAAGAEVQLPASVVANVNISPDDSVPVAWICPYIK